MAIRLLRESSDTPNITNKDDVRMIRYAYGGYNGVVQKYGEELAGSASGGTFRIGSGRVVLHGWEVDVEGDGWTLDLSSMSSGIYYYTVYLEVNAELETAEIKYLYDTAQNPVIDPGDDLTEASAGTAQLELYHFTVSYGVISDVTRVCMIIPYGEYNYDTLLDRQKVFESSTNNKFSSVDKSLSTHDSKIGSIESRLSALGFRQGSCFVSGASTVQNNSLKRQGNYVIMDVVFYTPYTSFTITIPSGFRPKSSVPISIVYRSGNLDGVLSGSVSTSGTISANMGSIVLGTISLRNIGWETGDS